MIALSKSGRRLLTWTDLNGGETAIRCGLQFTLHWCRRWSTPGAGCHCHDAVRVRLFPDPKPLSSTMSAESGFIGDVVGERGVRGSWSVVLGQQPCFVRCKDQCSRWLQPAQWGAWGGRNGGFTCAVVPCSALSSVIDQGPRLRTRDCVLLDFLIYLRQCRGAHGFKLGAIFLNLMASSDFQVFPHFGHGRFSKIDHRMPKLLTLSFLAKSFFPCLNNILPPSHDISMLNYKRESA